MVVKDEEQDKAVADKVWAAAQDWGQAANADAQIADMYNNIN